MEVDWLQLEGLMKADRSVFHFYFWHKRLSHPLMHLVFQDRMQNHKRFFARGTGKTGSGWSPRQGGCGPATCILVLNCLELKALLWGCLCLCLLQRILPVILVTAWSLIVTSQKNINKYLNRKGSLPQIHPGVQNTTKLSVTNSTETKCAGP